MSTGQAQLSFEVRPGEGIGPFRLGMTREELRELAHRELGIEMPVPASLVNYGGTPAAESVGETGIWLDFDDSGRCVRIGALYVSPRKMNVAFMLFGRDVTGLDDEEVIKTCWERWRDLESEYSSITSAAAGFSATYWDNSDDGAFCSVCVQPPSPLPQGAAAPEGRQRPLSSRERRLAFQAAANRIGSK